MNGAIIQILSSAIALLAQAIHDHGSPELKAALATLDPILAAVQAGDFSKMSPVEARLALDKLSADLFTGDRAADLELMRRFHDDDPDDHNGDGL